jgi:3-oxoacyl-[acyl-carrier protein] reductase
MRKSINKISIDLKSKTALITGGTKGIGKAIVDLFYKAGAHVIVTGTLAEKKYNFISLYSKSRFEYIQADFSQEQTIQEFVDKVSKQEKIDVLVNNAGINIVNRNIDTSITEYDAINNVNLKAPYLITREISRIMIQNKYGRIINISSIWSVLARPGRSIYSISKCGLVGLSKALSLELAEFGILVNSISPGFTLTELTEKTNTTEELKNLCEAIPLKRLAATDEIANLALFLASDLNTYITGQNIIIDGGYSNA